MKKFLLPLLACGMYVGAFAQIEASGKTIINPDKWVITANNLKTATGRLLMDKPAGSKWTVYIYSMANNKQVISFNQSNYKGQSVLSPGEYKITINNAPVENVQIKKGHDTKLVTGILDIGVNAVWYLYDETGKTSYTSGNKPGKLVLPVGNYRITINNAPIENVRVKKGLDTKLKTGVLDITDNTVWYVYDETGNSSYTSGNKAEKLVLPIGTYSLKVGVASKLVVVTEESIPSLVTETDEWLMTPINNKNEITRLRMGRINLNFDSARRIISVHGGPNTINIQIYSDILYYDLAPGQYFININGTVVWFPIREGWETKIKHGYAQVLTECDFRIDWGKGSHSSGYNGESPIKILLPAGAWVSYHTGFTGLYYSELFTIINGITYSTKVGYLSIGSGNFTVLSCITGNGPSIISLTPGKYQVNKQGLGTVEIEIKAGETTTLPVQ